MRRLHLGERRSIAESAHFPDLIFPIGSASKVLPRDAWLGKRPKEKFGAQDHPGPVKFGDIFGWFWSLVVVLG